MKKLFVSVLMSIIVMVGGYNVSALEVNVRIESHDRTILNAKVDVKATDISSIVGGSSDKWTKTPNNKPLAMHAIVKALQEKGFDLSNKNIFDAGSTGSLITKIDGVANGSVNSTYDGWMFTLNNSLPSDPNNASMMLGIDQATLNENDSLVVYFAADWMYNQYSFFNKDFIKVFDDEKVSFTNSQFNILSAMFGQGIKVVPAKDAYLVFDQKQKDGSTITRKEKGITSDVNGLFDFKLNSTKKLNDIGVGTYNVTSERDGEDVDNELTRASLKLVIKSRALDNLIKESELIDKSKFSSASYNKFALQLKAAKNVFNNDTASKDEVNKVISSLKDSKAKLELKKDDSNNGNSKIDSASNNVNYSSNLPNTGFNGSIIIICLLLSSGLFSGYILLKRKEIN